MYLFYIKLPWMKSLREQNLFLPFLSVPAKSPTHEGDLLVPCSSALPRKSSKQPSLQDPAGFPAHTPTGKADNGGLDSQPGASTQLLRLDLSFSREKGIWQQRALPLLRVRHHEIKTLQDETSKIQTQDKKIKLTMWIIKKWKNMLKFVAGSSALNILQQNVFFTKGHSSLNGSELGQGGSLTWSR